jgi:hypothetical protein
MPALAQVRRQIVSDLVNPGTKVLFVTSAAHMAVKSKKGLLDDLFNILRREATTDEVSI